MVILTSSISLAVALQGAVAPVSAHPSCAGFPPAAEQGLWSCCHGAPCKPCLNKCTERGWVDVCPLYGWRWLNKDRMSWWRPFWMVPTWLGRLLRCVNCQQVVTGRKHRNLVVHLCWGTLHFQSRVSAVSYFYLLLNVSCNVLCLDSEP